MIHVALFSFQRTTLSFEALASSDSFIVPHLFQAVKNFFIFLSYLKDNRLHLCKLFPLKEPCLAFHAGRYLAATCIILQDSGAFVNTYFSKSVKFFKSLPCSIYKAIKNASIARCVIMAIGGGTEI